MSTFFYERFGEMEEAEAAFERLSAENTRLRAKIEQLDRDMCEIAEKALAEKDALRALLHSLLSGDPEAEREARALLYGPVEAGRT